MINKFDNSLLSNKVAILKIYISIIMKNRKTIKFSK